MKVILHGLSASFVSLFMMLALSGPLSAQPTADQSPAATNSTTDQIADLQLQLTNAWHQVEAIVNKPVQAYRRNPQLGMSISSPGWFHPGAIVPDFNSVDVRKSQELTYTAPWVSSDITPTLMFRGADLEFNSMTKLFYTNRSFPKKRLTEAEMVRINSLYRTIGHCQQEIAKLQTPPMVEAPVLETPVSDTTNQADDNRQPRVIAAIASVPRQTRIFYGSIAIGALLVLAVMLRLMRK